MGVGRIFSRGALEYFSKNFLWVAKSGEICFFPLETKKTTLFCCNFQNPGVVLPLPSDAHATKYIVDYGEPNV